MQSFFDWLTERAKAANSLLCVGLDPRATTVHELYADCVRIIDATHEYAAAFKPNSAFFEAFGPDGMHALQEVIAHVPREIPVILDAKRGDIGDTSEAYAKAAFDVYRAHAITVSPYLGSDSVAPFIARTECGAFVLCKTSNPGSKDFQNSEIGWWKSETESEVEITSVCEQIAMRANEWNISDNVGLVVGATDPISMARIRRFAPELWFLVPGIGAQGGDLEASLKAGLRTDGLGLLINASRSIARAANPAAEAKKLRDEINQYRVVHSV